MADGDIKKKKRVAAKKGTGAVKKGSSVKKKAPARKKVAATRKSPVKQTVSAPSKAGAGKGVANEERYRRYAALAMFGALVLFSLLLFEPFGSTFGQIDGLIASAEKRLQQKDYQAALDKVNHAKKALVSVARRTSPKDKKSLLEIAKRRKKIATLARKIREARAKEKLRADAEIRRLVRRAKQDESIGLYKRALDKMDKALDLLDKMEKDRPDDKRIRSIWEKKVKGLRKKVDDLRRRLAQKKRKEDRDLRGGSDGSSSSRLEKKISELQRRLDAANQRDRRRLQRELQRARAEKRRRDNAEKRRRDNAKKRGAGRNGGAGKRGVTVRNGFKNTDVKTKVKDVDTKSKTKVDYNKGEGLEKD